MGTLIIGGAAIVLCSNCTIAKIVASTGVIMSICGIKKGKEIAIGAGVIYAVATILKVTLSGSIL